MLNICYNTSVNGGSMNQDLINELRQKTDIVSVISEYIPLTKKGRNYFGLCPFHDDHTPSLSVSSDKQIFKCFVCGTSGNVFNFLMEYEHISFLEAVNMLAQKEGMELNLNIKKENTINDKYYQIMDIASKFYQNNLFSKEGLLAREYLEKRKLNVDAIKKFEIGLSLNKKDVLTKLLLQKEYSLEDLNIIDLANTNHDSYINRIIFPIHSNTGQVIGFSGRIYDNSDLNKYQNTKETPLFKKRETLYNYHRVKEEVRISKSVIVMEGFMAVIRSYINGIKNCVATMGTALSNEQAHAIKKLSTNIILCYDGDEAGRTATLNNGEIFLKLDVNCKVVSLKDNLDPDDYILKYGVDSFQALIDNAVNFTDYKIKSLKSKYDLNSVEDKTNYVNKVLEEIKNEQDLIKREIMIKNLATETNIWYNTLEKKLLELVDNRKIVFKKDEIPVKKLKKNKYLRTMESIVYYMLNDEKIITLVDNIEIYFPDKNIRSLINEITYYYGKYGNINEADFCSYLENNKELQKILKEIMLDEYPRIIDLKVVEDSLQVIKDYNVVLEIKRLENLVKNESDIVEQVKLMDEIRILKMKEGKS